MRRCSTSQYIQISNHVIHLKVTMVYVNNTSKETTYNSEMMLQNTERANDKQFGGLIFRARFLMFIEESNQTRKKLTTERKKKGAGLTAIQHRHNTQTLFRQTRIKENHMGLITVPATITTYNSHSSTLGILQMC